MFLASEGKAVAAGSITGPRFVFASTSTMVATG
jgi:hypothetical protein